MFELGFLKTNERLALGHMEIRIDEQASRVDDQITYLYKYFMLIHLTTDLF